MRAVGQMTKSILKLRIISMGRLSMVVRMRVVLIRITMSLVMMMMRLI